MRCKVIRDPFTGGTQIETEGPPARCAALEGEKGFHPLDALGGESYYSPCFAHEGTKREGSGTYPASHILYKVEQGLRSFGFQNPSHSLIVVILPKFKIIISHTVLKSAFAFNKYIMNIFPYI